MKRKTSRVSPRTVLVPSTVADLRKLLALIEAYYRFDQIKFDRRRIKSSLTALLRDNSLGRVWLIRFAGCDAGYVIVTFAYDIEFGGRQAIITDLYLAEKYRGMGLGCSTIDQVASRCRPLRIMTLELQVERHNRAAQTFYRKVGFQPLDRIPMSKSLR